ncbi:MAG: PLP-dependent transferase [Planctomycetota bacterium]|nr:MAG: PLP-dependent transferase [Planctomycetota bacterium]
MSDHHQARLATRAVHGGQDIEPTTGAVMPPVFLSTTYAQRSPGVHQGFDYIRAQNPTRYALERAIAALEGTGLSRDDDPGCGGIVFASGLASIGAVFDLIPAGSHAVVMDDLYGGTHRLLSRIRGPVQNLRVTTADLTDAGRLGDAMTAETRLVWVETPTNPTLKIVDLAEVARRARDINPEVILGCDSTFASPVNQRPLEHGFDLVMHSATKYLGGHSDVLAGALATNRADLAERLRFVQFAAGAVLGPFDCYLLLRGIKTLDVRVRRQNESALAIARWLEAHPKVERVLYPGLESHPQHALAARQMDGFTGIVTFFVAGGLDAAKRTLERVRLFALAESLGGVESLIEHPAIMTHASISAEQRAELGITDSLIRLSVGVEAVEDLIADLDQALA